MIHNHKLSWWQLFIFIVICLIGALLWWGIKKLWPQCCPTNETASRTTQTVLQQQPYSDNGGPPSVGVSSGYSMYPLATDKPRPQADNDLDDTHINYTTQPFLQQPPYPVRECPLPARYGISEYPPSMPMPMPKPSPQLGYAANAGAPYPPGDDNFTSYPPGPVSARAPYPPADLKPQLQTPPPSYDVAVTESPSFPRSPQTAHGKQSPYNPAYQS